jgi:hypothetical protein
MVKPAPKTIDADFEIVSGPYRVGDRHPRKRRWRYTGHHGADGVVLWYRPPIVSKAAIRRGACIFGVSCLVLFAVSMAVENSRSAADRNAALAWVAAKGLPAGSDPIVSTPAGPMRLSQIRAVASQARRP